MECQELPLKGARLLIPRVFADGRGFFLESYRKNAYQELGIPEEFVQDNHSYSHRGCIRGMHFQSEPGQAKLVRAVKGTIFDVIVDIRKNSPTFGQWTGVELSETNYKQLYVPLGFAHGFCVLSEDAHVLYKVSANYDPATEKGFRWDDPTVEIKWPLAPTNLSERDQNSPFFTEI